MRTTQKQQLLARWGMVALILATLVVYMPPFIRSFVGDDYIQFDYVKRFVQEPATILQVFNPNAVPWYYRPTQNIWFWLNRLILGWEPFGYYIILLWFHALAVALIYRVARQFRLGVAAALVTAVLFAIHAHWVDVVTWISSVAIVMGAIFSLAAVSAMMGYLRRPSTPRLLLVFFISLLALLTHEETVLLPPFLLLLVVMWRLEIGDWRLKRERKHSLISNLQSLISPQELLALGLLAFVTAVLIYIQFTRPNPTVQIADRTLTEWLAYLQWPEVAEFVLVTAYRFSFVNAVLDLSGFAANLFVAGVGFVLVVWLWQGNWVVRFWLLWALAHLFFIYWALWSQLPNLYAGRHIYQAGIGLALAIGGTVQMLLLHAKAQTCAEQSRSRGKEGKGRRKKGEGRWQRERVVMVVVGVLFTAVLIHHIREIQVSQRAWLANVTEEEEAKAQLYELIPELSPETHIFSFRFPISPDFTRSVMQVWYDVWLERPGGSLKHLAAHGRADPTFIVLDYADGQVYNLMPELADCAETIFLWVDQVDKMTAAGEANDHRLAVPITPMPDKWTGHTFTINVTEGLTLHTAVLAQPDIAYRLRLDGETLFEQPALPADSPAVWVDVQIPLAELVGKKVEVWLEATAVSETDQLAYWANPRLVR
ncbi:MAG: hypothetical protein HND44_15160 [Chloroflexi bacterium]|nr:hypothetical protein [Ardenticatenaceae bacterium]MBL1129800.1 hypothetical protein [Chloroflexota bacterium]NOG35885.1 hypothetical protein [Chloroflexota bacterium]